MNRRTLCVLVAAAALIVSGRLRPAAAQDSSEPPDLGGTWRLDRSQGAAPPHAQGEQPGGGEGHGGWGGGGGGGYGGGGRGGRHGGGHGGYGGARDGGASGGMGGELRGPGRLPDVISVRDSAGRVQFSDSTGALVTEITVGNATPDTAGRGGHVHVLAGRWQGPVLEVERPAWGGSTLTQTFALEDEGNSLVVHIRIEGGDILPQSDIKRVYRRIAG